MKKTKLNMKKTKPSIICEWTNEVIIKKSIIFKKNKCQSAEDWGKEIGGRHSLKSV